MHAERTFGGWTVTTGLGEGGQSDVFLVRSPTRQGERDQNLRDIRHALNADIRDKLATAIWSFARPDDPSELGALKVFKIAPKGTSVPPPPDYEPVQRLKNEIAALSEGLPGLPRLLEANEDERWIVTEYFPEKTLGHYPFKYKGRVVPALKAFRSLVQTTALLHVKGYVHRDIKPANVFVRDDELVLGDFGIVYMPGAENRVTGLEERVGPRDYMPEWGNLGARLEKVEPNFDVYMLGKLLWTMVSGRPMLPREHHRHPEYDFDLTRIYPNDPQMHVINKILDHCVVERPRDCLPSASDLLLMVDAFLACLEQGGQLLEPGVPRPCHICGVGFYQREAFTRNQPSLPAGASVGLRFWALGTSAVTPFPVHPFVCDNCGHIELFAQVRLGLTKGW